MPPAAGFDQVIDADGCLVLPGLMNMHRITGIRCSRGWPTAICSKTG